MVCTSVSPALRRWRQEYYKFKASQGYTDPVSKKKKKSKARTVRARWWTRSIHYFDSMNEDSGNTGETIS
jgi:hypothetical protein